MAYAQKTFSMQAGNGFVIDLGQTCGQVTVIGKAECYVRVVGGSTAPSAPGANPAPAGGASADYIHLAASGDKQDIGYDDAGAGYKPGLQDPLRWVVGWAVGSGDLLAVGH